MLSYRYFTYQIRTLGMLRSRFQLLPSAFNARLIPPSLKSDKDRRNKGLFSHLKKVQFRKLETWNSFLRLFMDASFHLLIDAVIGVWTQKEWCCKVCYNVEPNNPQLQTRGLDKQQVGICLVIYYLSIDHSSKVFIYDISFFYRERDLMIMPLSSEILSGHVRWPVFLLTNEVRCVCWSFTVLLPWSIYEPLLDWLLLSVLNSIKHCKGFRWERWSSDKKNKKG